MPRQRREPGSTLTAVFGPRALFPANFVDRGALSHGALLLRAVREDRELPYTPIVGVTLTGKRAKPAAQARFVT